VKTCAQWHIYPNTRPCLVMILYFVIDDGRVLQENKTFVSEHQYCQKDSGEKARFSC
jgi:hypothetical protein